MSSGQSHTSKYVGNDFIVPKPQSLSTNLALPALEPAIALTNNIVEAVPTEPFKLHETNDIEKVTLKERLLNVVHANSIAFFALLILAISLVSLPIASRYYSDKVLSSIKLVPSVSQSVKTIPGLNLSVSSGKLQPWIQAYTAQPATINLGSQTVAIDPNIIKSWLQITSNSSKTAYNIHLRSSVIASSLLSIANNYAKSPVNQVTITRDDGSSEVAIGGQNGTKLSDPSSLSTQADQLAKNLFSNKGFQVSTPLVSLPFQSITPSSFPKLLVADINSKKMFAYQNGQLVQTFLTSAGAPATPTPIGEFHIYEKLAVQNMTGYNTNGTTYFQPNVQWINYFDGGDAVHAVYWHPLSWFGVHNSSHGCIGVPTAQGQWIYNWAPIGTTVITTTS